MPRKPVKVEPEFPPECCGVCKFAERDGDGWVCWGQPPIPAYSGEEIKFFRGAPMDPEWPVCIYFKPRCHA